MKVKCIFSLLALLAALSPLALSQSRDTGAIVGSVLDEQKTPLPGATVTLTSPALMGPRTYVTEADGSFRFPALPPGVYALKASLQGFKDVVQENIRVTTTVRLTFDLTMQQAAMAEEITVVAMSPTVDVKSTETASVTLTNEILRNIPYVSNFSTDIVNLAPGVTANSAYGASQNTGIAYSMDGVNVADPEGGSAWVFVDMNIIEESKIMGVGLPAEYGNFTGVIFNLVTKSGGNDFSGHFEFIYQGEKNDKPSGFWQQDNIADYTTDFPNMVAPKFKLVDGNAHLGGPIMKDKLWFYVGTQYQWFGDWATGFPDPRAYRQPRLFVKLTSQLNPTLSMLGSLEIDTYDGKNRYAAANHAVEATINQKSPEIVGNFSLTKILSPKTFFDIKASYFWGYYYLDPKAGNVSAHWSWDGYLTGSAGYFYYADRTRLQINSSVTHYAEDFIKGNHDFKFGVEVERSYSRNRYGYPGPDHMTYYDYYGENYLAYQYEGYDTHTYYTRFEGFAQDSWQITDRININLGARFSQNWGTVKGVSGSVYSAMRLAPRIGFTYDIFGDKTTVLKAHYGQFTEAMLTGYHASMNPASAFKDRVYYYWDGAGWEEYDRLSHEELYHMADDIKHPYLNQFTVSLERELFRDASFSVTGIYRDWKNIISYYDTKSDYQKVSFTVPSPINKTFDVYERISPWYAHYYVIDNIEKENPRWWGGDPYRRYWGIEFLFNKRFSNRWQLLASYVYSKAWGTQDNGFGDDFGWNSRDSLWPGDPNFWINADGNSTIDPTHMLKLQGTYMLPFEIAVNAYYRAITGNAWTTRYRTRSLNQGRVTFYAETRGSNHYSLQSLLDLRIEKIFTLAQKYRLGFIFDAFNVFNSDTITSWGTRIGVDWVPGTWPSTEGHNLLGIVRPRMLRLGIRMIF